MGYCPCCGGTKLGGYGNPLTEVIDYCRECRAEWVMKRYGEIP